MKLIKKIKKAFSPNRKYLRIIDEQTREISKLKSELERKPSVADLMRENLGSLKVDFTKDVIQENGVVTISDYLDGLPEEKRIARIAQGNELWKNEMFHVIWEYLVNKQGNFTVKQATTDSHIFAGRMTINGFELFKKEVERCHFLFEDINSPKEGFDPHEVY